MRYSFKMWKKCYIGMYPHCLDTRFLNICTSALPSLYRNVFTFSRHRVSQYVDVSTLSPLYRDVSTMPGQ